MSAQSFLTFSFSLVFAGSEIESGLPATQTPSLSESREEESRSGQDGGCFTSFVEVVKGCMSLCSPHAASPPPPPPAKNRTAGSDL